MHLKIVWLAIIFTALTWQQKNQMLWCRELGRGIVRNTNAPGRTATDICRNLIQANEFTYDDSEWDDCYEYLNTCPPAYR